MRFFYHFSHIFGIFHDFFVPLYRILINEQNVTHPISIRGHQMTWDHPLIMAIINVTSDSFSDVVHCLTEESILARAQEHISAGADILDLGACSTRPGSEPVDAGTEWKRIQMAANVIRKHYPDIPLSVDTFRAEVAEKAVTLCGVDIINDISGGQMDEQMLATAARLRVPYILTHTRGTSATMQSLTQYDDIIGDLLAYFREKIAVLKRLGAEDIIIDPGFGFAKTVEQNYELLRRMSELQVLGLPILAGLSHKTMIYRPLGVAPHDTVAATTALHMICLQQGAAILRVHETKEAVQCRQLAALLQSNDLTI